MANATGPVVDADFEIVRELKLSSPRLGNVLIAFADALAFTAIKLAHRPAIVLGMREMRAFKRGATSHRGKSFDVPED